MKAHIDADSGVTITLATNAANVNDITNPHALLHGGGSAPFGDAVYQGAENHQEIRSAR